MLRLALILFLKQCRARPFQLSLLTAFSLCFYLISLGLMGSTVSAYLHHNVNSLLGADSLIESWHTPDQKDIDRLRGMSEQLSWSQRFSYTLTHAQRWQSVEVKVVDDHYPIHGKLIVADQIGGTGIEQLQGPEAGEIWLDPRAVSSLGLLPGDELQVGSQNLRFTKIIRYEPDRLNEGHSVAMRAMVHRASTMKWSLPDKVRQRFLMAASVEQQRAIAEWQQKTMPEARLVDQLEARHPLAEYWQRAHNFLGLACVLLLLLGGLTYFMTSSAVVEEERQRFAVMQSAGLTRVRLACLLCCNCLLNLLVCLVPASLLASSAVYAMAQMAEPWVADLRLQYDGALFFKGLVASAAIVILLQLPLWVSLFTLRPAHLIRRIPAAASFRNWSFISNAMALALVIVLYTDNLRLSFLILLSIALCFVILILSALLCFHGLGRLARRFDGLLAYSIASTRQRLFTRSTQIIALGLSLCVFVMGLKLSDDFISMFERVSRANNGNLFVSYASIEQKQAIESWAADNDADVRQWRPFQFAQLLQVNDQLLDSWASHPSESKTTVQDPIRLSWSETQPRNIEIIEGSFEKAASGQGLTVEEEVAEDLGLSVGDSLTFSHMGAPVKLQIAAIHRFKPGDHSITFWFIAIGAKPKADEHYYMGSVELPEPAWKKLPELWQQHPDLRMVPLQEYMRRIDTYYGMALTVLLSFNTFISILATLLIYAAAFHYAFRDRKRNGLFMSFGLGRWHCLLLTAYEWGITSVLACFGAVTTSVLVGQALYRSQFGMDYRIDLLWFLSLSVSVVAMVVIAALYESRSSLNVSPLALLREQETASDNSESDSGFPGFRRCLKHYRRSGWTGVKQQLEMW